jgi:hypothetical protein
MEQRILSHACRYGHVDIVRKMLDRGVDSNLEASRTTLYLAAGSGDIATMELLRQRGAILGRYGKRQRYRNELAAAAVNGNYRAVDLLVSWGIAVDDESMKFNMRAMIWEGNLIGVQCLISLGFDSSNLGGNYYLLSAVWAGREHAVEFFLKQGTDPNPPPSLLPHCNPLYAALESRHYRIARMLLAYGANRITLPRRFVDRNGVLNPVNWINHHVRNRCGCNCSFSEYSWAETPAWHHQRRELDDEVLALALACKVDAPVRCQHDPPQLNPPMIHKEHDAMEWVSFDDLPLDFMQE